MRSHKRVFTLQTFKALKKIEDKITLVLAIAFKFLLKSTSTPKKRKMAEAIFQFTRTFSGRSGQLQTGKLGLTHHKSIIENKINK